MPCLSQTHFVSPVSRPSQIDTHLFLDGNGDILGQAMGFQLHGSECGEESPRASNEFQSRRTAG
jgi:hypothetical protein